MGAACPVTGNSGGGDAADRRSTGGNSTGGRQPMGTRRTASSLSGHTGGLAVASLPLPLAWGLGRSGSRVPHGVFFGPQRQVQNHLSGILQVNARQCHLEPRGRGFNHVAAKWQTGGDVDSFRTRQQRPGSSRFKMSHRYLCTTDRQALLVGDGSRDG